MPAQRIRARNQGTVDPSGDYVLYWMVAYRRVTWNFALQHAADLALRLGKPLVIFEPLRVGYRWASDRMHRFVLDGMGENQARIERLGNPGIIYYPYVEPQPDADKGLLAALAERACVVVTDDWPAFFVPHMQAAAAARLRVRLDAVDSNGLLPLSATDRVFTTAFSFRAFLQKELPRHLTALPIAEPLAHLKLPALKSLPPALRQRWPAATARLLAGDPGELAALPIDHTVAVADSVGGTDKAQQLLRRFLDGPVLNYAAGANDLDVDTRSGLSPYLHFGHIAPQELFHELMTREDWQPAHLGEKSGGKREGWWGISPGGEAWLDELITWRELGFNMCWLRDDYDRYETLPDWAQATLAKHASDRRQYVYSLDEFSAAATHDPLWNAAQRELRQRGRIHNYLRMLWGKKILEWTESPRVALDVMIELNNRYALDGRDPNSYSGIFWVLGRYDRAWGPERPIFGTIRFMTSASTARKLKVQGYLQRFGAKPRSLWPDA